MQEFLAPILFRVQNVFTVLSRELQNINSDNIIYLVINGGGVFFGFYFISRYFRAYILRLGFFIFGALVLWNVSARASILHSFDFYSGLGMIIPQLEIVEITYLLLKERTLFVYNQFVGLIILLVSPFVWLYKRFNRLFNYFKAKQEEKRYKNEEFAKQQKRAWEEEQRRYDKKAQEEFRQRESKREEKQQKREEEKKQYQQKQTKQEEKTKSRWDSTNPYEVLGIDENATASEIKKAYRTLAKIYHPDLSLLNKEEAEEIFKKINSAYESLS